MRILVILALVVGFVGCAKNITPGTTPPAVQVAGFSKTLADALVTANRSLIALRDQGKILPGDATIVQNYIVIAANAGKAMDAELVSPDPWATQESKIIQIWAATGLEQARSHLSPEAGVLLDTIVTIINEILKAVGGPIV